jgi:hypothetical protein
MDNLLMAHGFRRKALTARCFPPSNESAGVPPSPLESTPVVEKWWRRLVRRWGSQGLAAKVRGLDASRKPLMGGAGARPHGSAAAQPRTT